MRASSLRQHWSQGQCNIVDHRKLVLVINNDKNKQRWVLVHSPYLGAGQQQIKAGLSYRQTGLSGDLIKKDMKEALGAQYPDI